MGAQTSMTQQVFRQRSPLVVATVSGVTGLLLLGSVARSWARYPQPLYAAWVLFALAWVWVLFVRPAVRLDGQGVTMRNVLRDIHIPWALISYVECRWNLRVFVGDRGYTAWAISTQIKHPSPVPPGLFGRRSPAVPERPASSRADQSMPAAKVTGAYVARSIEKARGEHEQAEAHGAEPPAPAGSVRVTWVPLVIVVLLLPAVAVVALSLV